MLRFENEQKHFIISINKQHNIAEITKGIYSFRFEKGEGAEVRRVMVE